MSEEQSHREAMNAAIRAQRERAAAPRTVAPAKDAPPEPESGAARPARKSLFGRLLGK
jgi:hypothetical protein